MSVDHQRRSPTIGSAFTAAATVTGGLAALAVVVFVWIGSYPRSFFAGVCLTFGAYLVVLWVVSRRAANSVDDPVFTIASAITAARAAAAVVLGGFVVAGEPSGVSVWLPAALFAIATALDAVDGYVARRLDATSTFGAAFDIEVDGLAVLVGAIVAVGLGAVPMAFVAIGLYRYAFVLGTAFRHRYDRPVSALPPSRRRTAVGVFSMIALFVVLLPLFSPTVTRPLAVVAMVPITYSFAIDWLYVSGRLTPAS